MRALRVFKKALLVIVPLVVIGAMAWYLRTDTDFFVIKDLKVDLELQENQEALLIDLKPEVQKTLMTLKGQNIWGLSLKALRQQLLTNPWIQQVELRRHFPSSIEALVRLNPVAVLFVDNKDRIFPILESGEKLPQIKAALAPVAPLLRNNNILKDEKQLKLVLKLFSDVPFIGALKKENIESIDYNSVTGLSLQLIDNNVLVHLGKENIQTKALQVLRVTDYLESQKQKARVIDASFTKKVLVRLRKRS